MKTVKLNEGWALGTLERLISTKLCRAATGKMFQENKSNNHYLNHTTGYFQKGLEGEINVQQIRWHHHLKLFPRVGIDKPNGQWPYLNVPHNDFDCLHVPLRFRATDCKRVYLQSTRSH